MSEFLHRADAPFGSSVWTRIDQTVVGAASGQLSARRLLEIEGPYGLGLKTIAGADQPTGAGSEGISVGSSAMIPVATIRAGFALPVRDIANFEQTGMPFDAGVVAQAAMDCARQEDDLLFNGSAALGVTGLLNAPQVQTVALRSWQAPGEAVANVIEAVGALDDAGLHGPYALGLAPRLYNQLFRRYDQGNMTEMEHMRTLITGGIVKAPAIADGGVVVAVGKQFVSIVLGQDLACGFVGPTGGAYEFFLMESLALRVSQPAAVCVMAKKGK